MCLKVLCDTTARDEEFNLFEYSWQHFVEHLEAVNKSKLAIDGNVLEYLLCLFRDESIIKNLLDRISSKWIMMQKDFIQAWLIDSQLSQVIIAYFSKANNSDQPFDPEQQAWLRKDSFSARDLFQSLVCVASEIWLTDPDFGDQDEMWVWEFKADFMIWLLYFYSQLVSDFRVIHHELVNVGTNTYSFDTIKRSEGICGSTIYHWVALTLPHIAFNHTPRARYFDTKSTSSCNFLDDDRSYARLILASIYVFADNFFQANPQIEQDNTSQVPDPNDEGLAKSVQQLDRLSPLSDIPANKLIKLATLGKVEKTTYWHANLAYALYSAE